MYKILIVEDEYFLREGFKRSIDFAELDSMICAEAKNGLEGLEKIRQHHPDIVITDLRMPVMDGLQMLRLSKVQESFEAIILTGYEEFGYAKEAISLGVVEYLLKPIDRRELKEVIIKTISRLQGKTKIPAPESDRIQSLIELPSFHSPYSKGCYDYICKHYQEKARIEDIAESLDISVDHLNRVFKIDTSLTIHKFLIRYRIVQACYLMKHNNNRIYEVAEQVGFNDYKHFYQVFTKLVGISPTDYKKEVVAKSNQEEH